MSKILVLRHGITEGNKNRWFYGAIDIPLLPEGIENLKAQKARGVYPEIPENAQFITTGLLRTRESLEALFGPREFDVIEDLQEMNFGELEGKSFDEIKDEPAFTSWSFDETGDVCFPGGESRNQFAERVRRGTDEVLRKHEELRKRFGEEAFTVLVCHGGVLSLMLHDLFPNEREDMWHWMSEPGFGYIIEVGPDGPTAHHQIGDIMERYEGV